MLAITLDEVRNLVGDVYEFLFPRSALEGG